MNAIRKFMFLAVLVAMVAATPSLAIIEEKSGTEYPDEMTMKCWDEEIPLQATGVGLREKTFMKVDVYTIVSYVKDGVDLGDDPAATLRALNEPRLLRMDLRRGFSREKLVNSFVEGIENNFEDTSAFATEIETFLAYFERDAQEGDVLIFDYCPGVGLRTNLNGEEKGIIAGEAFAEALWTVWFGEKPANKDLRKRMLSALE